MPNSVTPAGFDRYGRPLNADGSLFSRDYISSLTGEVVDVDETRTPAEIVEAEEGELGGEGQGFGNFINNTGQLWPSAIIPHPHQLGQDARNAVNELWNDWFGSTPAGGAMTPQEQDAYVPSWAR